MQEGSEVKVRSALYKFGFDKHKADTKVGELSGGEKARLLFCLMSFDAPHIMLLDEPTNHLDIDAREALKQALNNYTGAVILVSHDPHLVEHVADQLWLVSDGKCVVFDDDLDAYRKQVIRQRRMEREKSKQVAGGDIGDEVGGDTSKLKETAAQKLELQIAGLNDRKAELEELIAASFSDPAKAKQLKELNKTYDQLQKDLTHAENELAGLIAEL